MARLRGELFARLSLDYFDHPKIMALSAEAIVAHLEMIVYSRKYRTDGAVPMRFAMRFASQVLDELASNDPESPSIIRHDDGSLTIHGYADMQETAAQIDERRQARREAGRAGAQARWRKDGTPDGKRHSKPHGKRDGKKMAETETETETEVTPPKAPQGGQRKGTRLAADWMPTKELVQQMRQECPSVDLEAEHRIFVDYWIAQPGQKGVKVDWPATWRNWMRRKQGDRKSPPKTFGQQRQDNTLSLIAELREEEARGQVAGGNAAGVRQIDSGR